LKQRRLSDRNVSAIGLGCMGFSHAYGTPMDLDEAKGVLRHALDIGYTHFDTATAYGRGKNEQLVGEALRDRRSEFFLASKCGLFVGDDGREIDGHPARIRSACEDSLKRLGVDFIDLYYLHRLDKRVPIEDSVGALAELKSEGKIGSIGLSEVSARTVRRAHAVHPIAAVQSEYSLWTRNPELGVLDMCAELGITLVAFSPLGRGFLSGRLTLDDVERFGERDIRRRMPRFLPENYSRNLDLLTGLREVADDVGCTLSQLALAWVLSRGEQVVAIPGTTKAGHLEEDAAGAAVDLPPAAVERLDALMAPKNVVGHRYSAAQQADIDTEEYDSAEVNA